MEKGKKYLNYNKIKFEGEYLYGIKWNGIVYNYNNVFSFEIKNKKAKGKEYDFYCKLNNEGEYIYLVKEMVKEKNMMVKND